MTQEQITALAGLIVDRWASSRLTQATPAERDLARWLVEWMSPHATDLAEVWELKSWVGEPG